ncbi:MAG: universal stress protein [Selenomonas sp.]|nr:universal stress protein [Selenomonas sp.]
MKRKRILVPVDGSEGSAQAVALAGEVALATGCTLDILHVSYFDSKTDSQADSWLPDEVAGDVGNQQQEVLDKARASLPENLVADFHLRTGNPVEEILRFAHQQQDWLIVVGGRGLGAVEGFLMGSVSQQLLEESPVSVLVARNPAETPAQEEGLLSQFTNLVKKSLPPLNRN